METLKILITEDDLFNLLMGHTMSTQQDNITLLVELDEIKHEKIIELENQADLLRMDRFLKQQKEEKKQTIATKLLYRH